MNERTKEGTMVAHLYHISDPGAFGVKHSGRIEVMKMNGENFMTLVQVQFSN